MLICNFLFLATDKLLRIFIHHINTASNLVKYGFILVTVGYDPFIIIKIYTEIIVYFDHYAILLGYLSVDLHFFKLSL